MGSNAFKCGMAPSDGERCTKEDEGWRCVFVHDHDGPHLSGSRQWYSPGMEPAPKHLRRNVASILREQARSLVKLADELDSDGA